MALQDFTHECTVGFQGALQEFRAGFCNACAQRQCSYSFVNNSATAKKIQKHQDMMQIKPPAQYQKSLPVISEEIRVAPVVETSTTEDAEQLNTEQRGDSVVQFVEPEKEVTTANLAEIKARLAEAKSRPEPQPIVQPQPAVQPQVTKPPELLQPDAWAVPLSHERVLDYREKEPAKDPWSKDFNGNREIKGQPGIKITVKE